MVGNFCLNPARSGCFSVIAVNAVVVVTIASRHVAKLRLRCPLSDRPLKPERTQMKASVPAIVAFLEGGRTSAMTT
jgi:hypothetical protein